MSSSFKELLHQLPKEVADELLTNLDSIQIDISSQTEIQIMSKINVAVDNVKPLASTLPSEEISKVFSILDLLPNAIAKEIRND